MLLLALTASAALPTGPAARAGLHDAMEHHHDLACKTGLVESLRANWADFTPEEREAFTAELAPFRSDLFAPVVETYANLPPPPPATDSCWSWSDNRLVGDHFVVEWEDGVSDRYAEIFLEALEYSWEVEVEELGWMAPEGSDRYLMLAYIENANTGGAYTTVERCGGDYVPYMVAGKDSWSNREWGDTMAAHEFNHAIQFAYSYAPEFWWWEATATWVEDYVYPDSNLWAGYVTGYTMNTHIALGASDQQDYDVFYHMYGMAIWAFYLDNYHGGHDTVQATWDNATRERGQYEYGASDMLEDLEIDFRTAYDDFTARNTVMDYEDRLAFPTINEQDSVNSVPASGESSRNSEPQGYGQNYVRFDGGLGDGDLVVTFQGDDAVDWSIGLVESSRSEVLRTSFVTAKDGEGEVTLTEVGENDIWLVMSPLTTKETGYDYEWSAELVESAGADADTDTDTDADADADTGTDTDDASGDDKIDIVTPGGCGCSTGGDSFALGAMALATAALVRRRR